MKTNLDNEIEIEIDKVIASNSEAYKSVQNLLQLPDIYLKDLLLTVVKGQFDQFLSNAQESITSLSYTGEQLHTFLRDFIIEIIAGIVKKVYSIRSMVNRVLNTEGLNEKELIHHLNIFYNHLTTLIRSLDPRIDVFQKGSEFINKIEIQIIDDTFALVRAVLPLLSSNAFQITEKSALVEEARSNTLQDELTRAYTKKPFVNKLFRRMEQVRECHEMNCQCLEEEREYPFLSLLLIEIDGFKNITDNHGKNMGEYILKTFAEGLNRRSSDVFARVGNEKFALLINENEEDAILVANRIIKDVCTAEYIITDRQHNKKIIPVSVSVGIATYPNIRKIKDNEIIEYSSATHLVQLAEIQKITAIKAGGNTVFYKGKECKISSDDTVNKK